MYIVSVMPLERKAHTDLLSYFSTKAIPLGTIVEGTWRRKTILGIVTECAPALKNKLLVKESGFTLKKIQKIIGLSPLSKEFLKAVLYYSEEYGSLVRVLFDTFIPKKILTQETKRVNAKNKKNGLEKIFIGSLDFRVNHYKKIMEEGGRTLFVVPTQKDADRLEKKLKDNGFEKLIQIGSKTSSITDASIYISTPNGLGFPFPNLSRIVIEFENSHLYTLRNGIHAYLFTVLLAKELNISILRGALVPSIFSVKAIEEKKMEIIFEKQTKKNVHIVSSKENRKNILSQDIKKVISEKIKNSSKIFIFTVRRGYAEVTICNDCKTILRCSTCNRPLVLHKQGNKNWYLCHNCGTIEDTTRKCNKCDSWNLRPLGIGSDSVYELIKKEFSSSYIYKIDSDETTTEKKLRTTLGEFYKTGGILVGTEMALRQLEEKSVDLSVIASFDSLFALPHFSIEERMLEILSLIEEKTKGSLIIQTIFPEQNIFSFWKDNTTLEYLHTLLLDRKNLAYPPYGEVWIVEKVVGTNEVEPERKFLETQLLDFVPHIFINKTKDKKLKIRGTVVMRTEEKESFLKTGRKLKSAGYTLRYNPSSLF